MTNLSHCTPPVQAGPILPMLTELSGWLFEAGYLAPERLQIISSVLDYGTLEHAAERGHLDAEDYAMAEELYVDSQPPIPWDDPAWSDDSFWQLGPPEPPVLPAAAPIKEDATKVEWKNWEEQLKSLDIKPVSGGGDDAEPDVFERLALAAEKIISLQAELDAIPADWRDHYYPY
jgi:hypothetical protein